MSSRELIESLRKAGEEGVRHIQQDAEREAEAIRAVHSLKLAELRRRCSDELAAAAGHETSRSFTEAAGRARLLRLAAEKSLSERLLSIAAASLERLRQENYPAVFEKLRLELPPLPWKTVLIHPVDVDLARKYFTDAELVPTESIKGGMDVTIADKTIRVINTLEKRLERAWTDLLPRLIQDVYREVSHGASENTC